MARKVKVLATKPKDESLLFWDPRDGRIKLTHDKLSSDLHM